MNPAPAFVPSLQLALCAQIIEKINSRAEYKFIVDSLTKAQRRIDQQEWNQSFINHKERFRTMFPEMLRKHAHVLPSFLSVEENTFFLDGEEWSFGRHAQYHPREKKDRRLQITVINTSYHNDVMPRKFMRFYFDSYDSYDSYAPSEQFIAFCQDMLKTYFFKCDTQVFEQHTISRRSIPTEQELEAD